MYPFNGEGSGTIPVELPRINSTLGGFGEVNTNIYGSTFLGRTRSGDFPQKSVKFSAHITPL